MKTLKILFVIYLAIAADGQARAAENISCDGERPKAEVKRRYAFLKRVEAELMNLDGSVKILY